MLMENFTSSVVALIQDTEAGLRVLFSVLNGLIDGCSVPPPRHRLHEIEKQRTLVYQLRLKILISSPSNTGI